MDLNRAVPGAAISEECRTMKWITVAVGLIAFALPVNAAA
jgi:hypothetical protein